jgi:hypothetical protein
MAKLFWVIFVFASLSFFWHSVLPKSTSTVHFQSDGIYSDKTWMETNTTHSIFSVYTICFWTYLTFLRSSLSSIGSYGNIDEADAIRIGNLIKKTLLLKPLKKH